MFSFNVRVPENSVNVPSIGKAGAYMSQTKYSSGLGDRIKRIQFSIAN